MTLQDLSRKVKIQGQFMEVFGIERGLWQGDALSTTLFGIVLEKVMRYIETNQNETLFNRTRRYIACTDDVLVLG